MSQQVPGSPLLPVERRLQETRSLESSTTTMRAAGAARGTGGARCALEPSGLPPGTAKAGFTRIPGEEFADLTEQRGLRSSAAAEGVARSSPPKR